MCREAFRYTILSTAIAICHHFGVPVEKIKEALLHVSVKGRIEIVPVTKKIYVDD